MPHRILHLVSEQIQPAARWRLMCLLNGLTPGRDEVHLLSLGRNHLRLAGLDHVQRHTVDTRLKIDPRALKQLKRQLGDLQPDVIHHWDATATAYGLLALGSAKPRTAAVVESAALLGGLFSESAQTPVGWLARWLRRLALQRTSAIVAWSETACSQCTVAGLPADQIRLIPQAAVPFELLPEAVDIRGRLQIPPDARVIAAFGPEGPGVHLKNVIWAFDLVQLLHKKVHLVIIDSGPRGGLLKQFRDDLEVRDCVHFIDREMECPEIGRLMVQHVDAVWSADVRPVVGRWLPRILASGIPVIAVSGGEASEMIRSEASGYLVSSDDRAGYVRTTGELLGSGVLHQQISQEARESMRERYGRQAMVDRHLTLYDDLIGRSTERGLA